MQPKLLVCNVNAELNVRKVQVFPFNLDYDVSVENITFAGYSTGDHKINIALIGSATWLANDLFLINSVFWGILPFNLKKPLIIPKRSGIQVDILGNASETFQIILHGYIL